MYPLTIDWIPVIILIPLLGALLNALFGKRLGKPFVRTVGVGAPLVAFVLSLAAFSGLFLADQGAPFGEQVSAVRGTPAQVAWAAEELVERRGFSAERLSGEAGGTALRVRGIDPEALEGTLAPSAFGGELDGVTIGRAADTLPRSYTANYGRWIEVGDLRIDFSFVIDRLAIILMLVITGVGTLIHLYSTGYMAHESPGTFARYFTYLNLFVGSMLLLVMGGNLLLMFIGWEGVGLCSYLLIGFEYRDADKAACGTKAFVVNRIGDVGFVLGALVLLVAAAEVVNGPLSLDFDQLNGLAGKVAAGTLGVACLLLFLGATGKSAQLPLHLWLPDAMAGPTPVSALIHAATMVTAGIYMIARLGPMFAEATIPLMAGTPVLGVVAIVGILTAFFAAAAALGQDDIKKVLAYSTISQLGYMFVAVGAAAMGAAVFHLVTHAFFKALLFLGAGAVIHATGTQSMKRMGGLRRSMPTTFWTMLVGAAALAGFPLLAGFFSKDLILLETLVRFYSEGGSWVWGVVYTLGVLTGLLTAVYSTRMICMTFLGDYRGEGEPHEAPPTMTAPLVILGVLSVLGGLLGLPALIPYGAEVLPHYLAPIMSGVAERLPARPDVAALHTLELIGLAVGAVAAVLGVLIGWSGWGRRTPAEIPWETQTSGALGGARAILANAWYYDLALNKRIVQPVVKYLSLVLWRHVDDAAIDRGLVDGTGRVAVQLSLFARVFQNGKVSTYIGYVVIGAILVTLFTHAPAIKSAFGLVMSLFSLVSPSLGF